LIKGFSTEREVGEVNHVAAVGMGWVAVDLLSPKERENTFGIARIFDDQVAHERYRVRNTISVGVVECKPHPENDAPLKALSLVGPKFFWGVVPSSVEQVGSNNWHFTFVEDKRSRK